MICAMNIGSDCRFSGPLRLFFERPASRFAPMRRNFEMSAGGCAATAEQAADAQDLINDRPKLTGAQAI